MRSEGRCWENCSSYLVEDFFSSILQVNRGFLYTVKELFIRPGKVLSNYLAGKRVYLSRPLSFLIVTSTIYILVSFLFERNTMILDLVDGFKQGATDGGSGGEYSKVIDWVAKNQNITILLVLPLFSLASYLAFLRSGYNFFEHLVLNIYITGQQMLIYCVLVFFYVEDNILELLPLVVAVTFNFWVYYQVFDKKSSIVKIALMLLTYFLFIIIINVGFLLIALMLKVFGVI